MTVYVFDGTMDGLLTAVFDAYALTDIGQLAVGAAGIILAAVPLYI